MSDNLDLLLDDWRNKGIVIPDFHGFDKRYKVSATGIECMALSKSIKTKSTDTRWNYLIDESLLVSCDNEEKCKILESYVQDYFDRAVSKHEVLDV